MSDIPFETGKTQVITEAELERRRLAEEAEEAKAKVEAEAQAIREQVEREVSEAKAEVKGLAEKATVEVTAQALVEQAKVREIQSVAEREAEAAKARAREAQRVEIRKHELPFTKPQRLNVVQYIADVEAIRRKAHREGKSARIEITKARDNYIKEIDKTKDDVFAQIEAERTGINAEISKALTEAESEIAKQIININSGIKEWESESLAKIAEAEHEYKEAVAKYEGILTRLAPYKTDKGYDLVKLIQKGFTVGELRDFGFFEDDTRAAYKFNIALEQAKRFEVSPGKYDLVKALELEKKGHMATELLELLFGKAVIDDTRRLMNQTGEQVFAGMKAKGLVGPDAVYKSYDKATGIVTYTEPDTRSGEEIFAELKAKGEIPEKAIYKSYDKGTGTLTYTAPRGAKAISTAKVVTTTNSTQLQNQSNLLPALGMGAIAIPITWQPAVTGLAISPDLVTKIVLGGIVLAALGIYMGKEVTEKIERLREIIARKQVITPADVVVTDQSGTMGFTLTQIKGNILTTPYPVIKVLEAKTPITSIKPLQERLIPVAEHWLPKGYPGIPRGTLVMTKFPLETDPFMRGKARDLFEYALAVERATNNLTRVAVKELLMTREEFNQLFNEALRQANIRRGKEILDNMAQKSAKTKEKAVSISKSLKAAYEEYLRKKAILDAARKAYVASLNPQPVKGVGSNKATAAAVGIWLVIDIIRDALAKGKSLNSALKEVQTNLKIVARQLGLTQMQITSAISTVVYQQALSDMITEGIKAASLAQTQNLTRTQVKQATLQATETQIKSITQQAVSTKSLTQTQANSMVKSLEATAKAVATLTGIIKLPPLLLPRSSVGDKRPIYPPGTIVWNQGELDKPQYKIIPPPYDIKKPITSDRAPKGMIRTRGTPQQTLTFIGGKLPFKDVAFDLGIVDGFIDVKNKRITFRGEGEKTNVGTRLPSLTKGLSLGSEAMMRQIITPINRKRTTAKFKHRKQEHKLTKSISVGR